MHILVVDDEDLARLRLVKMIESLEGHEVVGEATNGAEALAAIEEHDPDIVLMDVRMPGEDGLSAAHAIADLPEPPAVIFCTAYNEYALEAFETLAVGYLLKPVQEDQLVATLSKAQKTTKVQKHSLQNESEEDDSQRKHISAKTRKGVELIPIINIHCFVADHKYVTVVHEEGETLIDDTLKELELEFPKKFVRVHRNSLVAIEKIEGMERNSAGQYEIKLKEADYRPVVSRRHVASVRELLSRL